MTRSAVRPDPVAEKVLRTVVVCTLIAIRKREQSITAPKRGPIGAS
ncbi:hypothetical protein [Kitasatospora purpeofusca]